MTTQDVFEVGDEVRITGTLTDAAGTPTDPSGVFAQYKNPSGVTTTLEYLTDAELIKLSTGVYYVDIDANDAGTWNYRFYSTGTGQSAAEGDFRVRESAFA